MLIRRPLGLLTAVLCLAAAQSRGDAPGDVSAYPGVGKGDHFLASGPLSVVLTRHVRALDRTTKIEANLLLLKQEGIIYQEKEKSGLLKPTVREAPSRYDPILSIQADVGGKKVVWTL